MAPPSPRPTTATEAIARTHYWFEVNSGWAPPDEGTLTEWLDDGVCRSPDDCLVAPEQWCRHGLASWWLILDALSDEDQRGSLERNEIVIADRHRGRSV